LSRSTCPVFSLSSRSLRCGTGARRRSPMPMPSPPDAKVDPGRYFESVGERRSDYAARPPVCVYLETTNRCNLLCTTCPRTYAELEPPADMSWELFISIVDQIPDLQRAVLHGVGEPMLVRNLARMVRYLKQRGIYVLFNTNGTLLNERNGRALIEAGLDELRVSLDASNAKSFLAVRGKDYFGRILRNVRAFRELQEREGKDLPRVSAWLTGLKETIAELPAFVRLAAEIGVREVYLQRRALPCCIEPFSQRGYEHYTLGDATQQALQEIWNGAAYGLFREALLSDKPPATCANCGLRWSL